MAAVTTNLQLSYPAFSPQLQTCGGELPCWALCEVLSLRAELRGSCLMLGSQEWLTAAVTISRAPLLLVPTGSGPLTLLT